jgi:rubrerythrin
MADDSEQRGFRFYSRLAPKADDPGERAFCQQLPAEEKRHLQMFEDTRSALVQCGSSVPDEER